jgi:hypothetical protein
MQHSDNSSTQHASDGRVNSMSPIQQHVTNYSNPTVTLMATVEENKSFGNTYPCHMVCSWNVMTKCAKRNNILQWTMQELHEQLWNANSRCVSKEGPTQQMTSTLMEIESGGRWWVDAVDSTSWHDGVLGLICLLENRQVRKCPHSVNTSVALPLILSPYV